MSTLIVILIVIAAVALGFIVLIQNPKGGGLAGNVGGISNQLMGVKQTTDVLEKGTWILVSALAVFAMVSVFFFNSKAGLSKEAQKTYQNINTKSTPAPQPQQTPANTAPVTPAPAPAKP